MNTWSSKPVAALSSIVLLSACDVADTGTSLLASITPPHDAALPAVPLTQALMMRGNVTLVPPSGYCIDAESLSQSFALMARCDTLGAATGGAGAPIGVLTVSFARSAKNANLPTPQEITAETGLDAPESTRQGETSVVFKTKGSAPSPDLSPTHWRSVSMVGDYTMGAALFGQAGHRAVSSEGADVLEDMIKRTSAKSNAT
jgi:hypothetical protein